MKTVAIEDADAQLSTFLPDIQNGDSLQITRHGIPVARIVPEPASDREDIRHVIEQIREIRQGVRLDGLTIRQLIEEGRR